MPPARCSALARFGRLDLFPQAPRPFPMKAVETPLVTAARAKTTNRRFELITIDTETRSEMKSGIMKCRPQFQSWRIL